MGTPQRFRPLFTAEQLRPAIDSVLLIEQAEGGHARMVENRNIGTIILKVR